MKSVNSVTKSLPLTTGEYVKLVTIQYLSNLYSVHLEKFTQTATNFIWMITVRQACIKHSTFPHHCLEIQCSKCTI